MKLFTVLLEVVLRLLDYLKLRKRRQIEEEYQDEAKTVEENPDAWFDEHFGGGVHKPAKDVSTDNATEASTGAESSRRK